MIVEAIQSNAKKALVSRHAIREAVVGRVRVMIEVVFVGAPGAGAPLPWAIAGMVQSDRSGAVRGCCSTHPG